MRWRTIGRAAALGLALALGTGCASSAGRWHGPRSDHFDGERFHNANRTEDAQLGDAFSLAWHALTGRRGRWAKWTEVRTDTPPARVWGGELRVTFVNHATVLLQVDSLNVLTDPIWSTRASPFSWIGPKRHAPAGIRFEDLPPIDLVVLSHNHYDHMDLPTLRRLVERFHPRILVGLGNAAYLAKHGVPGAEDVDWWQGASLGSGRRVTGVPAQHWSARSLFDRRRTLWLGFVLETPSGAVYYAGDTGYGDFFPAIRDSFPPFRLALLPISPARPRKAMAPRHLSAGDAVRVDSVLGAATAMAIHFGTFQQADDSQREPVDSLTAALAARGAAAPRFWVLGNGEARLVPALPAPPPSVPSRQTRPVPPASSPSRSTPPPSTSTGSGAGIELPPRAVPAPSTPLADGLLRSPAAPRP